MTRVETSGDIDFGEWRTTIDFGTERVVFREVELDSSGGGTCVRVFFRFRPTFGMVV